MLADCCSCRRRRIAFRAALWHYGQFQNNKAAKNIFAVVCHIYELCNTNLKFLREKENLKNFLNRAYSEEMEICCIQAT